jgi:hypothetical protein
MDQRRAGNFLKLQQQQEQKNQCPLLNGIVSYYYFVKEKKERTRKERKKKERSRLSRRDMLPFCITTFFLPAAHDWLAIWIWLSHTRQFIFEKERRKTNYI